MSFQLVFHFNGELISTYRTFLSLIDLLTHLITISLGQYYGHFQFHIYLLLYMMTEELTLRLREILMSETNKNISIKTCCLSIHPDGFLQICLSTLHLNAMDFLTAVLLEILSKGTCQSL